MGILACIGVVSPFPFYYFIWTNPQSWLDLCGKGRDPCKVMAMVSHFLKLVQFISLYSVSTLSWPPPFYFWPLFIAGQFLNFRSVKQTPISLYSLIYTEKCLLYWAFELASLSIFVMCSHMEFELKWDCGFFDFVTVFSWDVFNLFG